VKASVKGAAGGALAGKRVALKDSIMVAGLPMTNGASLLEGYAPKVDATVVTRVLDAGAEIAGKTHCEYFCLSGGSHTGAQGPVHNPHRRGFPAGGSSSGSAVALVTVEADCALGAEQAGSIRVPASFWGTVGMQPTYGLVPYTGIAPIAGFIDHVGTMTMRVRDNALLLEMIAGRDDYDPRQRGCGAVRYTEGIEVGVCRRRTARSPGGAGAQRKCSSTPAPPAFPIILRSACAAGVPTDCRSG
jgi:amidase